ncbi:hypothetical protein M9Y10_038971 [Tritrichomonas musculus]|uniref:Uncharacterized protein n=1 Tax=Tritrichomonas musculus TaxID=1915356 RepID=A0ABR2KBR7_9EUKA
MCGEYFSNLLHKFFGFPTPRTCRNIKSKYRSKYGIGGDILNGSFESIKQLKELLWKSEDQRCVVAVDAASVNTKLQIHKDGQVDGLLEELTIDSDIVDLTSTDIDIFFVFYVCSLSEQNRSFPIFIKEKNNGAANEEILRDLNNVIDQCKKAGFEMLGASFDGDPGYLCYIEERCLKFIKLYEYDLKKPLSKIFSDTDIYSIYEDLLHLVKCCHYRLVCGSYICPSLSKDEATFNVNDFLDIGGPAYVLDQSRSKKMDDTLPIQLFSQKYIKNAISILCDLLLALLPSYLLINSVLTPELTRSQRIELLTFGFAIVSTYYNDYIIYDFKNGKQIHDII